MINSETGVVTAEEVLEYKWEVRAKEILTLLKGVGYEDAIAILNRTKELVSSASIVS
jgi:hypothetical protein